MYDSPIRLAVSKMTSQFNDDIYNAVVKTGIVVDKDELVRALNYDRNQYEKGYRDGLKASKWISVKERPPEVGEDVLVYLGEGILETGWLLKDGYWETRDGFIYPDDVTHWQPLPQLPKEEGENT